MYDTAANAQPAVDALKAGGFRADDISVFDKARVNLRESGIWQRLFGGRLHQHEADVYNQASNVEAPRLRCACRTTKSYTLREFSIFTGPFDVQDRAVTIDIAPAGRVHAAAASIAAAPLAAAQKMGVSAKLTDAHGETLRLAEEQLKVGKRMVETVGLLSDIS